MIICILWLMFLPIFIIFRVECFCLVHILEHLSFLFCRNKVDQLSSKMFASYHQSIIQLLAWCCGCSCSAIRLLSCQLSWIWRRAWLWGQRRDIRKLIVSPTSFSTQTTTCIAYSRKTTIVLSSLLETYPLLLAITY